MICEFAFENQPGNFVREYRRTRWSNVSFFLLVFLPFGIFIVLSILACFDLVALKEWDMNPLGWFILTLSINSFLLWLLIRRAIGYFSVSLYENGMRLRSVLQDLWIPWEEIDALSREHTIFYVKLIPLNYNIMKIRVADHRFDIESGTGFVFSDWELLFVEIHSRSPHSVFEEKKDWLAF